MFSSILLRSDKIWSQFSKTKKGNSVPPCACLSSSLSLAGAKNTIKIVVSGDNSGSKVKREIGDVAFWAKKGEKHYKNRGHKKGTTFPPCFAIFLAPFLGPKIGGPENEVKNTGGVSAYVRKLQFQQTQKTLENKGFQ